MKARYSDATADDVVSMRIRGRR